MASQEKVIGHGSVITLSPTEAVELVTLLTGQLANCPVPGNVPGAAPSINLTDRGHVVERLSFVVDRR